MPVRKEGEATSQQLKTWPDWPQDDRLGLFRLVWEPGVEHDDRLVATVKRVIASLNSADVRLQLVAAELSKHLRSQPQHAETRVPSVMKDLVLSSGE